MWVLECTSGVLVGSPARLGTRHTRHSFPAGSCTETVDRVPQSLPPPSRVAHVPGHSAREKLMGIELAFV